MNGSLWSTLASLGGTAGRPAVETARTLYYVMDDNSVPSHQRKIAIKAILGLVSFANAAWSQGRPRAAATHAAIYAAAGALQKIAPAHKKKAGVKARLWMQFHMQPAKP